MKHDFFRRLQALFEKVIELPAAQRGAFLDQECSDPELRKAVEALIAADEEAGAFLRGPSLPGMPSKEPSEGSSDGSLEAPAREPARSLAEPGALTNADPTTVGPYRLIRRIGQGGMGVVYLAGRDDDSFQRRVVVKLVRQDIEDEHLLLRLRNERQILAGLDHPNIARLFDGGSMEGNRPYFVMEYIEGTPIDEHCDRQQLSIGERLELFRKVCSAVHFAHQNLVVHRDLKPSNILITADGEPKLLDFGIAKLLNPELSTSDPHLTASWHSVMTPQFASPEQVSGQPVTTAADVYSLGILLFKLLAGRYPFDFSGRLPREIEAILTQQEPPKPSSTLAPEDEGSKERARQRQLKPAELTRQLRGDLDSITLKALRSAPQRRYESAEHFSADIGRFQEGMPVEAHQGTLRYRGGKLVKRHRAALAALAVLAVLLLAFTFTVAWQSRQVAQERDLSKLEMRRKEAVLSLLLDILKVADPHVNAGKKLTVEEALANSRGRLQHRLSEQPSLHAEALHTTGQIYYNLGLWEEARSDLEDAVTLRRGLHGEHHETAESLAALALVDAELGDLASAREVSAEALAIVRRQANAGSALLSSLISRVIVLCFDQQYEEASPLALEAVQLGRSDRAHRADQLADALSNLATVHLNREEYQKAADFYRQSVAIFESLGGEENPALMRPLNNLGSTLRRGGDPEGAEAAFQRALDLQKKVLGDNHPALAATLNNLAGLLSRRGQHKEAEAAFRHTLELLRREVGEDHSRILFLQLQIAKNRLLHGESVEVEEDLARLIETWRPRLPPNHRFLAWALELRGEALMALERYQDAEPLLLTSQEMLEGANADEQKKRLQATLDKLHDQQRR